MSNVIVKTRPQGPILNAYYKSRARNSFIRGPLGSGKTIQSCQKLLKMMTLQKPNCDNIRPSRFIAVRNTYSDLFNTTIKDWLGLFGELGSFKQGSKEPPSWRCDFDLDDGSCVQSEVVFLALDRPDAVKKLRGSQVTGFWLNETKELSKAIVDMADLRHGRYPSMATGGVLPSWHGMIGDTNAPDEDHWYYDLAESQELDGWEFYTQPGGVIKDGAKKDALGRQIWIPNPDAENIKNLPDQYYIKGMAGKSDDWISVNLANEYGFVVDGRPVYPEYVDEVHCPDAGVDFNPDLSIGIGWDYGLTPCIIIVQLTDRGQFRVIDEIVSDGMGVKQFARDVVKPYLAANYKGASLVGLSMGDPAGNIRHETDARCSMDILNDVRRGEDEDQHTPLELGFVTEVAPSQSPIKRQGALRHYLTKMIDGRPGIVISKKAKTIRKGFQGGYKYRRLQVSGEERFTDSPDKNQYSHPHDALQYIALGALAGMIGIKQAPKKIKFKGWG